MNDADSTNGHEKSVWEKPTTTKLLTGGTFTFLIALFSAGAVFGLNIMFGRLLTKPEYGIYSYVDKAKMFFRTFTEFGFGRAGGKFIAEYLVRDDAEARKYGIEAAKYTFLLSCIPSVVAGIILLFVFTETEGPAYFAPLLFMVAIILFDRLREITDVYLSGYQRYDVLTLSQSLPFILALPFGYFLAMRFKVAGAAASLAISDILAYIAAIYFVSRISHWPVGDMFSWKRNYGLFRKIIVFILPFAVSGVTFGLLNGTLLLVLLRTFKFLNDEQMGSMNAGYNIATAMMFMFMIVQPILQATSEAHAMRSRKLIDQFFKATLKFPIILGFASMTFFFVLANDLLGLMGEQYTHGLEGNILRLFCPFLFMIGAAMTFTFIISGIGKPQLTAVPWLAGLIVSIPGAVIGVGIDTYYGPIIGNGIGVIITFLWITYLTVRTIGAPVPSGFVTRPLISSVVTGTISFLMYHPLKDFFHASLGPGMGQLTFCILMMAFIYCFSTIVLCFLGGIDDNDLGLAASVAQSLGPIGAAFNFLIKLFLAAGKLNPFWHKAVASTRVDWVADVSEDEIKALSAMTAEVDLGASSFHTGQNVKARIYVRTARPLHEVVITAKVGYIACPQKLFIREIEESAEATLEFTIPPHARRGKDEITVRFEMNEKPTGKSEQQLTHPGLAALFDYRMKWIHEDIQHVEIKKSPGA